QRDRINPIVARATASRDFADLAAAFDANGVCWGPYRTLSEALRDDPDFSGRNPVFATVAHESGHRYLTAGAAAPLSGFARETPRRAPRLGEHTDQVLSECLGLSAAEIARLHDRKIVAG